MTSFAAGLFVEPRPELAEAELAAAACLQRCLRASGATRPPFPLPVDTWIETVYGIDFGFEPLSPVVPGRIYARGRCWLTRNRIRIHSDLADRTTEVRWVAAHELGHAIMHAERASECAEPDYNDPAFQYNTLWERQADRFAAALLMPPDDLAAAAYRLAYRRGGEHASKAMLSDTPDATLLWTETVIPGLAGYFGVSVWAVVYRVADLRLADGAPFLLLKHAHRLGLLPAA